MTAMRKQRAARKTVDPREAVIAERLKTARLRARLTQAQVAEAIGRTQSAVSDWERGTRLPEVLELLDLADLYRVRSFETLLRIRPEPDSVSA